MNKESNSFFRVLVVGVGGQGVLTIARIAGEAALLSGLDVSVGQLHGMSQRGGAVSSTVVVGSTHSAIISKQQADVVLGCEPLEVMRALPLMSEHTKVIVNIGRLIPSVLALQGKPYPAMESILTEISSVTEQIHQVDGPNLTAKVGTVKSLNFVMLGALAGLKVLPFDDKVLWKAVEKRLKPQFIKSNRQAFELGMEATTS